MDRLLKQAERHVSNVDIVVFPEAAMNFKTYGHLASLLKGRTDVLISGVIDKNKNEEISSEFAGNAACMSFISPDHDDFFYYQNKHHRWKLDSNQIEAYSLGDRLDPNQNWWENIAIRDRSVNFFTFNTNSCFATLVCEDLARIDPCQNVVRAIGPSILFALLMDGPQLKGRWSERYAMGLSDDPGTSVLTVTSTGLLTRSNTHFNQTKKVIGLWKDSSGSTKEITLPDSHEGIILTLNQTAKQQVTLDGRLSVDKHDVNWRLTGTIPLSIGNEGIRARLNL